MRKPATTLLGILILTATLSASAQVPEDGAGLYTLACASCHGEDGAGTDPGTVAFVTPVPDFTDCSFASREPDADWIAVAHDGGPVRAFDETMPAFGEALTVDHLQLVMDHIRTFCKNVSWPRGELNLPRALFTEKAYPEDEAVTTVSVDVEGSRAITNTLLYERRFGPRSQFEVEVPIGLTETGPGSGWRAGFGDIALGIKHALFHSFASGSILSLGGEIKLPTGSESAGLGGGTVVLEPYISFGQILPSDAFVQLQALAEFPTETDNAASEGKWRAVVGKTWTQGSFGRTWTPMLEVMGETELENLDAVLWDLVPQVQVTLNTRQHVMLNAGMRIPVADTTLRSSQIVVYILWDWFDGGLFDGW